MSNNQDFILSRLNESTLRHCHRGFNEMYENIEWQGTEEQIPHSDIVLSKDTAQLGLVFLNCFPNLRDDPNADWRYVDWFYDGSKRFDWFKSNHKFDGIWEGEGYKLLEYIFGVDKAPYVRDGWELVMKTSFQQSKKTKRRAFCGTNFESFFGEELQDWYLQNQLNFIIGMLETAKYDMTLEEFAICSPESTQDKIVYTMAAAINAQDPLKQSFLDIVGFRHTVGKPNHLIIKSMLLSDDVDCWQAIGNLILSVQNNTELFQFVLHCVEQASLGARKYLIQLILQHQLSNHPVIAQVLDIWTSIGCAELEAEAIHRLFEYGHLFLNHPEKILPVMSSNDNEAIYMALWAQGVIDVAGTRSLIQVLLSVPTEEKIALVLYFIKQVGLEKFNVFYANQFIGHKDLAIFCQSVQLLNDEDYLNRLDKNQRKVLFDLVYARVTEVASQDFSTVNRVFPNFDFPINTNVVFQLMLNLLNLHEDEGVKEVQIHFKDYPLALRQGITNTILYQYQGAYYDELEHKKTLDSVRKDFAFFVLGDSNEDVRTVALDALCNGIVSIKELQNVEKQHNSEFPRLREIAQKEPSKLNKNEMLLQQFHAALYEVSENEKWPHKEDERLVNDVSLFQKTAKLGLVFLNCYSDYRTNENEEWGYIDRFSVGDKRFLELQKNYDLDKIWDKEDFDLLEFFFGRDRAPFVREGWKMVKKTIYQNGWDRRSFRGDNFYGEFGPEIGEIYRCNQMNFIIGMLDSIQYDLTLEEYAISGLNSRNDAIIFTLASAINANAPLKNTFLDIIYGRHETEKPNRTIIKAMLLSDDVDCWTAVEKLLLSAQRQEGLRQTILECLDETSIGAMKHMIDVILEHKLTRFSSVVRALGVWTGLAWDSEKESTVRRMLELAQKFLNNPDQIYPTMLSNDNAEIYMALWAQGVVDVNLTGHMVQDLIGIASPEKISLALYFIQQTRLDDYNLFFTKHFIGHEDLVVFCQVVNMMNSTSCISKLSDHENQLLFDVLAVRVKEIAPKTDDKVSRVFSWLHFPVNRELVYQLMINLLNFDYEEDLHKILVHFNELPAHLRDSITTKVLDGYYGYKYDLLEEKKPLENFRRDFAFSILKDRSETVRDIGLRSLINATITAEEMPFFEKMLKRNSAPLRKMVLSLIQKHGVNQIKQSTEFLIQAKNQAQRLAGIDLLVWLYKNEENEATWVQEQAAFLLSKSTVTAKEEIVLSNLSAENKGKLAYDEANGYGLFDPTNQVEMVSPAVLEQGTYFDAVAKNPFGLSRSINEINTELVKLAELFKANKEYEYTYEYYDFSTETTLLGNYFREIKRESKKMTPEERFKNLPLWEVWQKWFDESKLTAQDLFIVIECSFEKDAETEELNQWNYLFAKIDFPPINKDEYTSPLKQIVRALFACTPFTKQNQISFLEGFVKDILYNIRQSDLQKVFYSKERWGSGKPMTWRNHENIEQVFGRYLALKYEMDDVQFAELWQLRYWNYQTNTDEHYLKETSLPSLYEFTRAYHLQLIPKDQLMWRLMKTDAINSLTYHIVSDKVYDIKKEFEFLNDFLEEARNRILEVELLRGDSATSVTLLAQNLNEVIGTDTFIQILKGLGKDKLKRGYIHHYSGRECDKQEVFGILLRNCQPKESQEVFNKKIKQAKISAARLCESATYSPQWLPLVAGYLGWEAMQSAVWWLHAHTNGYHSEQTEAEIAKYSTVDIGEFSEGAVDVSWFKEVYKSLGKSKWTMLCDAAKYISDGGGHRRALLYADVMLGKTKITEVTKRVVDKRNQDYLRVYGLIPLSKANPEKDVLKRYQFLQKFKKESLQFGSQRQESEAIAIRIAMDNLARTAGFSDPIRLQWAMETEEARAIISKAGQLEFGEVTLTLTVDENGKSAIKVVKGEKQLKAIPAKLKKEKSVLILKEFNKTLAEQFKRTKKSLELAMINGDDFLASEIDLLMTHPVVAPMLKKLVFISENQVGFWVNDQLVNTNGETHTIGKTLRIAHCTDIFAIGEWSLYQHHCFVNELKQPFKQIFRELYLPTPDELKETSISRRYEGHQVQPMKTVALLKGQGWTVDYQDGMQKVFHKQKIIAKMYAMADWFTPSDVESPTLETVQFYYKDTYKTVPFDTIDQRVFSEVMRDIDLVVSIAHVGDVDPEASHSTLELRTVIINETARLFKLDNVLLEGSHAKIKGKLGDYSVHLGSGVTHKSGVYLSILPVHSQHRGKLFLPFLDEDPKTAEIMSKILLLAKDSEIQDPTILRQF